ncbi:tetratricopeptide repeat protein [Roseomonas sp. BN140053]|uniref:tetratricopeptide repeat protein n=1 Tax=Roseomonas sp. BN140053 TaxID=3391898 RepID=UPI0039E96CD3
MIRRACWGMLACTALAAGAAGSVLAGTGAEGWASYNAQDYEKAVHLWLEPAAGGDAEAQFGLALAYDLGRGVPADSLAACAWYRQAGQAGMAVAAFNVAVMYGNGRCGPRRAEEAATWYAQAAARGYARAQYNLGQIYAAGDGVPRNPDQAIVWFRVAAAGGIAAALDRLPAAPRSRPDQTGELLPVQPVTPDYTVSVNNRGGSLPIAFIWTARPQPVPTRFLIEVFSLDGPEIREVHSRMLDETATLVPLAARAGRYAWRVLTVGNNRHYATSTWQCFETAPAERP